MECEQQSLGYGAGCYPAIFSGKGSTKARADAEMKQMLGTSKDVSRSAKESVLQRLFSDSSVEGGDAVREVYSYSRNR